MRFTEIQYRRKFILFGKKQYFVVSVTSPVEGPILDYEFEDISPVFDNVEDAEVFKARYDLYEDKPDRFFVDLLASTFWATRYNIDLPHEMTKRIWLAAEAIVKLHSETIRPMLVKDELNVLVAMMDNQINHTYSLVDYDLDKWDK